MSELVTFEQGMQLKRLGFRAEVRAYYIDGSIDYNNPINWNTNEGLYENGEFQKEDEYCSAPTVSDALDFIREERGIDCGVYPVVKELKNQEKPIGIFYEYCFIDYKHFPKVKINEMYSHIAIFNTHPEAETALLNYVLEYLKIGNHV